MNSKTVFFTLLCLIISTVIAQETADTPKRDYTMINFNSDLTCTLLEIGTTSLTFSVVWSPEMGTPRTLDLIGKLHPETRYWGGLYELELDQTQSAFANYGWSSRFPKEVDFSQRKAIFEVQYRVIPWYHMKPESEKFAQKAIFSVNFSVSEENWRKIYWGENWEEEERKLSVATAEAEVQGGEKTSPSQGKFAKQDGVVVGQKKSENKSNPNRLWLYAGILLLVCVGFYVLRRKLKTGN